MRGMTMALSLVLTCAGVCEAKSRYILQLAPSNEQTSYWDKGTLYIRDMQATTTVEVVGNVDELPDRQSTFRVYVLNRSTRPINFGPENVNIQLPGGEKAVVFRYDDLAGKARRDVKRRRALVAFAAGLSAMGANGQRTGSFDYSGMSSGGNLVSGSGTYTTYDPALAREQQEAVARQAQRNAQAVDSREANARLALDRLIQTTTIPPGGQLGGVIAYQIPPGLKTSAETPAVTVTITVGTEEHRLAGSLKRSD